MKSTLADNLHVEINRQLMIDAVRLHLGKNYDFGIKTQYEYRYSSMNGLFFRSISEYSSTGRTTRLLSPSHSRQ